MLSSFVFKIRVNPIQLGDKKVPLFAVPVSAFRVPEFLRRENHWRQRRARWLNNRGKRILLIRKLKVLFDKRWPAPGREGGTWAFFFQIQIVERSLRAMRPVISASQAFHAFLCGFHG